MTQPNSRTAISPVVVNSGMYTMSGPKTVNMGPYSPGVGQMTPPAQMYEEVPAREPDLTKKPIRSAMKGELNILHLFWHNKRLLCRMRCEKSFEVAMVIWN